MNVALVIGLIIAIVLLIICSAIISMIDIVYASVNQLRLKKLVKDKKSKAAKYALEFAVNYDDTLTTALFCNNLVNIGATSLSTVLVLELIKGTTFDQNLATTLMTIILLVILLVFSEILPKVVGRAFSYRISLMLAYPIVVLKTIFFPIIFVSSFVGKFIARPFIRNKEDTLISDDELQEIVDTIEDEGVIDKDQGELISNAIDFKDTEAREIMTPRVEMNCLNIDDDIHEVINNENIFTHSRIPVFQGTTDNIIGILPTKVLLRKLLAHEAFDIKELLVPAYYVPGSMGVSEILEKMKETKNHIVIVKDEYGGTDGLLTMEDILEELVGDMWDEMDVIKEPYTKLRKNIYEVDGSMNIDDLFSLVECKAPVDADYETVNGFILDKLERFAKKGDKISYKNIRFEVLSIEEFTVDKVLVKVSKKKTNA